LNGLYYFLKRVCGQILFTDSGKGELMKRFIKLMTIAIIMLVIAAMYNPSVEAASPKKMYIDIKPDVASAKISWDKKKVSYY
jgi:hypothetical protein